jgi:SAM-dependent methyltransferase
MHADKLKQLLIGCGSRRVNILGEDWNDLTTLDINPDHRPDVVWDLTKLPLPFEGDSFDQIHATEVLEHTGQQGDYRFFFAQFSDFWRVLRPNGILCATTPALTSRWLWGDPSHTRAIAPESLVFLNQVEYVKQIGKTAMSDFRYIYRADFEIAHSSEVGESFVFVIRAVKPSRWEQP